MLVTTSIINSSVPTGEIMESRCEHRRAQFRGEKDTYH